MMIFLDSLTRHYTFLVFMFVAEETSISMIQNEVLETWIVDIQRPMDSGKSSEITLSNMMRSTIGRYEASELATL